MITDWMTVAEVEDKIARVWEALRCQAADLKPSTSLRNAWETAREGETDKMKMVLY